MRRLESRRDLFRIGARRFNEPLELHLLRLGRPAMGSRFEIFIPSRDRTKIEAVHRALDEVHRLESLLSFHDPYSSVSRLNREAQAGPVQVEPEVWEILETSRKIWLETRGAFDPASGALWRCWGFHSKAGRIPTREELNAVLACGGMASVMMEEHERRVSFLRKGVELNFRAVGKGFALDCIRSMLENAQLDSVLAHAGYSSLSAWGEPAPGVQGWQVMLRDPRDRRGDLLQIHLRDQAMATSGAGEQAFVAEGRRWGHVLDPRSGMPADRYLSVTVFAPQAVEADALSTAFFVMAEGEIEEFCRNRPDIGVILVRGSEDETSGGSEFGIRLLGTARRFVTSEATDGSEVRG